jgi:hypothetical protein
MSTVKNLWGELPLGKVVRTPAIILREQAAQLTELTKGLLEGEVISQKSDSKQLPFFSRLLIVAPALDGYKFVIMDTYHDLMLYPVSVDDRVTGIEYECEDEDSFIRVVGSILSSDAVHTAIAALLSQSTSEQVA